MNFGFLVLESWAKVLLYPASSSTGSHLNLYAGPACSPQSPGLSHPMQGTLN